MDKRDRKVIHEIANSFKLKSKSSGNGKSRYPVLYKTSQTLDYDEDMYARIESRMDRHFLPRMDRKGGKKAGSLKRGGGGFSNSAVGYREGEVVGATAPELGEDNRGRALLEKMGWTKGMALGALDNKGILHPVQHVVKNSKFGLG